MAGLATLETSRRAIGERAFGDGLTTERSVSRRTGTQPTPWPFKASRWAIVVSNNCKKAEDIRSGFESPINRTLCQAPLTGLQIG